MRRARALPGLCLAGALALLATSAARAEEAPRTIVVVVDRSASVRYADPRGNGRAAVAFAIAFAARPSDTVVVLAPGNEPVRARGSSLETLAPALQAILAEPAQAGGVDLLPTFERARELAKEKGIVLAYTVDEIDVVDAFGHAPPDLLEKVRVGGARPDRKAVNEAAREALLERVPAGSFGQRFFALKATLPSAARGVPFLAQMGAQLYDLDLEDPREVVARLTLALGGQQCEGHEHTFAGDGSSGPWPHEGPYEGRFAVLAQRHIGFTTNGAIPIDSANRVWIVDCELRKIGFKGEPDTTAWVFYTPRADLKLAVRAFRTASHAAFVELVPSMPSPTLVASVHAGTAEAQLTRKGDRLLGSVQAEEQAATVTVTATLDGKLLPPVEARIAGAAVHVEPAGSAVAGAPLPLLGKLDPGIPDELVPGRFTLLLRSGSGGEATGELVRKGDAFEGQVTFPKAGSYTIGRADAGELEVGLASPIEVASPLPRLERAESRSSGPLEPATSPGKRIAALALLGVAALWFLVVALRRRGLAKLWGEKQLRGIGANGRISYERYLLRDHLESRRAAVAPPGPTAARVELAKDGKALGRAVEGSRLLRIAAKPDPLETIPLVHETPFAVVRGLYEKRYVYLEREPTADELGKRYVPDATSYEGSDARAADSDVIVLLEGKQNLVPPSQRLVPVDSERLPRVDGVADVDSDEAVVIADSYEEKVIDSHHLVLDPAQSSSAGPVPIIPASSSADGNEKAPRNPPIIDVGSSDEASVGTDHLLLDSRSSDEAPPLEALESGFVEGDPEDESASRDAQ